MKRIYLNLESPDAGTDYRTVQPFNFCHTRLREEGIELCPSQEFYIDDPYDAYVFRRCVNPLFVPHLKNFQKEGKTIAWDLDDLLSDIPRWNPLYYHYQQWLPMLDECLRMADYISVTTQHLKGCLGGDKRISVLPNYLAAWRFPPDEDQIDEGVTRILWAGSVSHGGDLALIVDDCIRIKKKWGHKVELVFFGMIPNQLRAWATFVPEVEIQDFAPTLAKIKPHIALAPLVPNDFNNCKSAIKFYEYTAVNAVTIASAVAPYSCIRHQVDGLLVGNGMGDSFFQCLDTLMESGAVARNKMRKAARMRLQEAYIWNEAAVDLWCQWFRLILPH